VVSAKPEKYLSRRPAILQLATDDFERSRHVILCLPKVGFP